MAVTQVVITEDRHFVLAADIRGMVHVFSMTDLLVGQADPGEPLGAIAAVGPRDQQSDRPRSLPLRLQGPTRRGTHTRHPPATLGQRQLSPRVGASKKRVLEGSLRVFSLADILESDSKGRVPGSYLLTESFKADCSFESASLKKRACKTHAGKVYLADGKKIVQVSISKLKVDTTYSFDYDVTAIEAHDQEVFCRSLEILVATSNGQLLTKKTGKEVKEFKPLSVLGLNLIEGFAPSALKYVPKFNVLVDLLHPANNERRVDSVGHHRDKNHKLHY